MPDTMINMELVHADNLTPDQLMEQDLIKFGDDNFVEVLSVTSDATGDNYFVSYKDDYGDLDVAEFHYTDVIQLYVYVDNED